MSRSAPRARWLEAAQVARAEGGEEALALLHELPAAAGREVLEAGERIAATSLAAAQAYAVAAPRVHRDLGARAFAVWAELGTEVSGPKLDSREAAVAYFRLEPAGVVGLDRRLRRRWLDLCAEVQPVSRRLAAACLEASGRVLPSLDEAGPRLEAWVRAGLGLASAGGWRGEFLAGAWFGAGERWLPRLGPDTLDALAALAVAVQTGRELQLGLLESVPAGFDVLDERERIELLALCRAAAAVAARPAREIFGALPGALAVLAPGVRQAVLAGFAAAASDPPALVTVIPLLPAILGALPDASRERLARRAARVGERFPQGYPRLLRAFPRAAGETDADGVAAWIDRGLALAADNPAAGTAYFALESRTSLEALRASSPAARFEEVQGILRSYARMLGAAPVVLRSGDGPSLRPFLDRESLDGSSLALPARVDLFDTWEENFALLKMMTANGVARLAFGTLELSVAETARRLPAALATVLRNAVAGDDLASLLDSVPDADPLIPLFAGVDGARLDVRLRALYRGYDAELRAAAAKLRRRAGRRGLSPELILLLLGAGEAPRALATRDLPHAVLETVAAVVRSPEAGPEDSLAAAILLRERLGDSLAVSGVGPLTTYEELLFERMTGEAALDPGAGESADDDEPAAGTRDVLDLKPEKVEEADEEGRGTPLSAEELRRLLEAGAIVRVGRGTADTESAGIFAQGLSMAANGEDGGEGEGEAAADPSRSSRPVVRGGFEYDEWDYEITDYRRRWCLLEEIVLAGDAGEFFHQTLERYADLLPEVRRQFQRIRPERYRKVRGLEDGEDFDLNAVVDARVDLRARRVPSSRLYVARRREERDVATLFLLDMSASTDEIVNPPEDESAPRRSRSRRIIDVTKEALVIMAEALDELGDRYAIYGFSGQGRRNVEVYPVKRFSDGLTPGVRGRIGGIEPRRSTRMGTALRHAVTKLANLPARSKHILLLSDGFPQDFDYGNDRRSNTYGIQDTMMALQECQAAGISPFCITVDKTGHDYLREMCESSRYLVIEDVTSLPTELPKIYERWVASRS